MESSSPSDMPPAAAQASLAAADTARSATRKAVTLNRNLAIFVIVGSGIVNGLNHPLKEIIAAIGALVGIVIGIRIARTASIRAKHLDINIYFPMVFLGTAGVLDYASHRWEETFTPVGTFALLTVGVVIFFGLIAVVITRLLRRWS